jgi:hypothetical protein
MRWSLWRRRPAGTPDRGRFAALPPIRAWSSSIHSGFAVETASSIRKGMVVRTSDGVTLGRVTRVWRGTDPDDSAEWEEEPCSRLQLFGGKDALYVPCSAVAEVSGDRIVLDTDRATTLQDAAAPSWIREELGRVRAEREAKAPLAERKPAESAWAAPTAAAPPTAVPYRVHTLDPVPDRATGSREPGAWGYVACYVLFASVLPLVYVAGIVVWMQTVRIVAAHLFDDPFAFEWWSLGATVLVMLLMLVGTLAVEAYLSGGLRRRRLVGRYVRVVAVIVLATVAGIAVGYAVPLVVS